jgi:SAM-dependent methyltransferase
MQYNREADQFINTEYGTIPVFMSFDGETNLNDKVVEDFGEEWSKFKDFDEEEIVNIGNTYFDIVIDQDIVDQESTVLDAGCGTGRWSKVLSEKVKCIEAIDPSNAVHAAKAFLKLNKNVRVTQASIDTIPFEDNSFDLVMSIGVLHHIPNTQDALCKLVAKIKPGGHFYGYLYYNLENRTSFLKIVFWLSHLFRKLISRTPSFVKKMTCDIIALLVYLPLAKLALLVKTIFGNKTYHTHIPLAYYSDKSFFIMRNDALDRFGTRLEKRYSKQEITALVEKCGLVNVKFSDIEPYWHFIAEKKK